MSVRRALLALLVVLVGCADVDVPQQISYQPAPRPPALSALSPGLGPPLAALTLWDATLTWQATVAWNAELERQSERAKVERASTVTRTPPRPAPARPNEPVTKSPKPTSGKHRGYATAKECVMWVENGGDYGRSSNPSHFGREQWSRSTWAAYGGNPAHWGTASAAEQDDVFERAWNSPGGPENWLPYDGCR